MNGWQKAVYTLQVFVLGISLAGSVAAATPVRGFVDLHNHQFANLGFGGKMFFGQAFSDTPGGIADALPWCSGAHGPGGILDLVGIATGQGVGHLVGGYPQFDGWPRWNTSTHQQVYVDWLKRAFDGGLKLMVVHAVNNELLCAVNVTGTAPGFSCNDMEAVDRQLDAAYALQNYVDNQHGGPGQGWYRIVTSAAEARNVINQGKMAIVLGIEVDNLFNCRLSSGCSDQHVKDELDRYYQKGVRHIFPIHIFNNGFGGASIYNAAFNYGNKLVTGDFFQTNDCSANGYEFRLNASDPLSSLVATVLGTVGYPSYQGNGQCNQMGLTTLGESLIRKMMSHKIIIDIDHMSAIATDQALNLAVLQDYPVVAGHTGVFGVSVGSKKAEGQKTDEVLARIRNLGGLVAPILHQGTRSEISQAPSSPVAHDCGVSSRSWAQAYLYTVQQMGGAVGLGSDFNGLAGEPAPRFGSDACANDKDAPQDPATMVSYPFLAVTGTWMGKSQIGGTPDGSVPPRVFDYNYDGLAHIGLLPDFVEDLRRIGLDDAALEPLFQSAEAYIRLWEKIESKNISPPSSFFSQSPAANAGGWSAGDVTGTITGSENPDGWGVNLVYSATGAQPISPTSTASPAVSLLFQTEGMTDVTFYAYDNAGNHEPVARTATVRLDKTRPVVNCAVPDGLWHATDVALPCTASDTMSGLANLADAVFNLATLVPAGTENANALTDSRAVSDLAGNGTLVGPVGGIMVDKKPPAITVNSPESGKTYVVNQSVTASYGCVDGGSGVATCTGPVVSGSPFNTGQAGTMAFDVSSQDNVGNRTVASVSYSLTYNICPLYDQGKVYRSGSAVPVRLQLCDVGMNNVSSSSKILTATEIFQVSTNTNGILDDSGNANPDNNFRYDSGLGGYVYNLSTKGYAPGVYKLRFRVSSDPVIHEVAFQVR